MTTSRRRTTVAGPLRGQTCKSCGRTHRTLTVEQCRDRKRTERSLQAAVIRKAKAAGWTVARVGKGWVGGDGGQFVTQTNKGWPDLVLFQAGKAHPVVAMELKRELGVVAPEQWDWLRLMNACGIPAMIIKPSDLREGRVDAILRG